MADPIRFSTLINELDLGMTLSHRFPQRRKSIEFNTQPLEEIFHVTDKGLCCHGGRRET